MGNKNSNVKMIMQELDYGDINVKLDNLMNKRNISTYELSTKSNVRFQTVQALRENKSTRIDLNVLAKLCFALGCNVEDIIEYQEKKHK
ncbi:MAG: helix-turn-helix transcriptional regulator [Clostridia bacterium]|nr:helix-turn-helix transcriptional regulator [Clostridia bacterium]